MKKIPYGRQTITDDDIAAVVEVLKSDFLTQGPQVDLFEHEFSEMLGAGAAVAVSNGTAALHLAAVALGVQPGHRVLVCTNTFVASANCVRFAGGDVEFVDIEPQNFCMNLQHLTHLIGSKPRGYYRGIVAVDFAGFPMNFQALREIADAHSLWIIEDACHALGAEFKSSKGLWTQAGNGDYADASVFSFHPVKHVATGEGGMVVSRNPAVLDRVRRLRTHGIVRDPAQMAGHDGGWYYEMQDLGYNYRLPDILCALGRTQLRRLKGNLSARRRIAKTYRDELKDLPLTLPMHSEEIRHAYHLFVVQTDRRKDLYEFMKSREIHCQVHYIPVHRQPYYTQLYGERHLPCAEKYYSRALSLPMYHGLTENDQALVIESLRKFFR